MVVIVATVDWNATEACSNKLTSRTLRNNKMRIYFNDSKQIFRLDVDAIPRGVGHILNRLESSLSNRSKYCSLLPAYAFCSENRRKHPTL